MHETTVNASKDTVGVDWDQYICIIQKARPVVIAVAVFIIAAVILATPAGCYCYYCYSRNRLYTDSDRSDKRSGNADSVGTCNGNDSGDDDNHACCISPSKNHNAMLDG